MMSTGKMLGTGLDQRQFNWKLKNPVCVLECGSLKIFKKLECGSLLCETSLNEKNNK